MTRKEWYYIASSVMSDLHEESIHLPLVKALCLALAEELPEELFYERHGYYESELNDD